MSNILGALSSEATIATQSTGRIKYLSPTSLSLWLKDRAEFTRQYVLGLRDPQTPAMQLGLAVDGIIKSRLGGPVLDSTLDASVVEDARYIVSLYDEAGVSIVGTDWTFEDSVVRTVYGVPLSGKPDAYKKEYKCGRGIILDWKVNGFYSAYKLTSPKPGYMTIWPAGVSHKAYRPAYIRGDDGVLTVNDVGLPSDWEVQMWMYGLMLGMTPGHDICRIEQFTFDTRGPGRPLARISVYQSLIPDLEIDLASEWAAIGDMYMELGIEAN